MDLKPTTAGAEKDGIPPEKPTPVGQQMLDKGAQMLQSFKPINHMSQHACTFALYSHDMSRQIKAHHFVTRLNQDFLQSAVYDSDDSNGRLIGMYVYFSFRIIEFVERVEYIVSDTIFETLPPEEQKLWHSHAYEVNFFSFNLNQEPFLIYGFLIVVVFVFQIKSGLWIHPRMPETIVMPELKNLAKTYGKFWCTWQTDRGVFQLAISLIKRMFFISLQQEQAAEDGVVNLQIARERDESYNLSREDLMRSRIEIPEPEWINPTADYWRQHKKGFKIDVESTEMRTSFS
ncbi:Protein of unknown function DUF1264 [Cynara cardunculus var. scolymus]|uniref:Uncharacterized protein n=1 Tax=Cynara cardunculus var. scolymus TaxID=59895 RepID=A0A118K058_CYNCS|nr:Protein of unknown function DUF1264 [Cynara cardunculus var. scolymus]